MNRYANIDCPACGKPLDDGTDVVVCPTCGAPYHLDCYKKEGACLFPELHESNESWQSPIKEELFENMAGRRCSRCNTVNSPSGIFCEVCGNLLNNDQVDDNPQNGDIGGFIPFGMPLNPYTTPFGCVSPDENIDDIPAKDLAIFVGRNSHYYLPLFKELSQTSGKSRTINWSAFFFAGGFFLYRKMYVWGIVLCVLSFIFSIPSTLMMLDTISTAPVLSSSIFSIDDITLENINVLAHFLNIAMKFTMGFFANSFYMKHTCKKIARIKAETENDTNLVYAEELTKKGSIATRLIAILVIAHMFIAFASIYMLLVFGI